MSDDGSYRQHEQARLQEAVIDRTERRHRKQMRHEGADQDVVCDGFFMEDCTLSAVMRVVEEDGEFDQSLCERCAIAAQFAMEVSVEEL